MITVICEVQGEEGSEEGKKLWNEKCIYISIWNVYCLEFTDIPEVFFTPPHIGYCCTAVIQGHCCTLCSNSLCFYCATVHLVCCNAFFPQQWTRFPVLHNSLFQYCDHGFYCAAVTLTLSTSWASHLNVLDVCGVFIVHIAP